MRSRLYEGRVWHSRAVPAYRLEHSVFYLELDLGELPALSRALRVLSYNRPNLLSVRGADYDVLSPEGQAARREELPDTRHSLLTMPRFLGYAFNPVSFLLSRDVDGHITHVDAEVHNTFGERHVYSLPQEGGSDAYRSTAEKCFYVSPLADATGFYSFELTEDSSDSLNIRIDESTDPSTEPHFAAGIALRRRELTLGNLLLALLRYPLLNVKVILAIHWHAFRTWLRGAEFHPHASTGRTHTS